MKINENKLFPYPLLKDDNDNFKNSKFKTACEYHFNEQEYEFKFNVSLTESNLQKLLTDNKVSILCHMECSKTKFRTIHKLSLDSNNIKINSGKLEGKLEIIIFICANENIEDYFSENFHEDYKNNVFEIKRGNILAISEIQTLIIENKKEEKLKVPTIFDITHHKDNDEMKVILNEDRIMISIPYEEFRIRNAHKKSINSRNIMNSMIVLPSLIYVLNELSKEDSPDDTYGDLRWFRVINKKMKELGYDLENMDLDEIDLFKVAQQLLGDLFFDSMESLNYLEELIE